MSAESKIECEFCNKQFVSLKNLTKHLKCVHRRTQDGQEDMEIEELCCSSSRCSFTTMYKGDLTRHIGKCSSIAMDRQIQEETQQIRAQSEAKLSAANETIAKQQVEIDMLRQHVDMLRQQLDKAYEHMDRSQQDMRQLAEKAIARPTVTNNQQNYGTVKITNYLADHDTYRQQTEREYIIEKANEHLSGYFNRLVNGQEALAQFVVEHIVKRHGSDEYILCCSDTSRKRFWFLNPQGEKVEDMMAKIFVSRIAGPIREVSGAIFGQIQDRLKMEREHAKGGDKVVIDKRMELNDGKYMQLLEFDISDKNGDFLSELAGLLRGHI